MKSKYFAPLSNANNFIIGSMYIKSHDVTSTRSADWPKNFTND